MGQMIDVMDFRHRDRKPPRNPYWYFRDTSYGYAEKFDITKTFPYMMVVHYDHLDGHRVYEDRELAQQRAADLRIAIRRWIEHNIAGDVLFAREDRTYWVVVDYKRNDEVDKVALEVHHGYYVFYFEHETDAVAFRLQFSEAEPKEAPNHPTRHHEGERCTSQWEAREKAERGRYSLRHY